MIPYNIDKNRFEYLVNAALTPESLKAFFREKKQALVLSGARVRNLPADDAARRTILKKLPEDAYKVVHGWLVEQVDEASMAWRDQLVPRYRAIEELGVSFSDDELSTLAKVGLVELYSPSPLPEWLTYLATPAPPSRKTATEPPLVRARASEQDWIEFAKRVLRTNDADDLKDDVLRDAAIIVNAFQTGEQAPALSTAECNSAWEHIRHMPAIRHDEPTDREAQKGLRAIAPETRSFDPDFDYVSLPILATRTTAHLPSNPKAPFLVVVEAFIDDEGKAFRMEDADMRRALPTEGRVALFQNKGFVAPPYGEAQMYAIESRVTDKSARIAATRTMEGALVPIIRLAYSTSEVHRIRSEIEQFAVNARGAPPVFVSTDGTCLRPHIDAIERVRSPHFDWILDAWDSLEAIELPSGTYILNPLPPENAKVSCAPLAAAAVSLIKEMASQERIGLTKAQRDNLLELLRAEDAGLDEQVKSRLEKNIHSIARAGESYAELIDLLMEAEAVRSEIKERINAEVARNDAERKSQERAIAGLKRQKERLTETIAGLKAQATEKSKAVHQAVANAFERATANELEAIGEASLLCAFLGKEGLASRGGSASLEEKEERPAVRRVAVKRAAQEPGDLLMRLGVNADVADRVANALSLAVALGLPLVVRGGGSRLLAEELTIYLGQGRCSVLQISVGLIENQFGNEFGPISEDADEAILLSGANLSDMSLYAPDVIDCLVKRALGWRDDLLHGPMVLALSNGPAGLPLPEEISEIGVHLDLDQLEQNLEGERKGGADHVLGRLSARVIRRLDVESLPECVVMTAQTRQDLLCLLTDRR